MKVLFLKLLSFRFGFGFTETCSRKTGDSKVYELECLSVVETFEVAVDVKANQHARTICQTQISSVLPTNPTGMRPKKANIVALIG